MSETASIPQLVVSRIQALERVAVNPSVLAGVSASYNAAELFDLFQSALVDEACVLDAPQVVEALLRQGDARKLLVLAQFTGERSWDDLSEEHLLALAKISTSHRCALVANQRINWYSQATFNSKVREEILTAALLNDDETRNALLRNPRTARNIVADAIRAKANFSGLSVMDRLMIACRAMGAEYIESPNYPGKDSPDSNETDFADPRKAFPVVLKEAFVSRQDLPKHAISTALHALVWRRKSAKPSWRDDRFQFDSRDWLTAKDIGRCKGIENWSKKHGVEQVLGSQRLIEWAIELGRGEPLLPKVESDYDDDPKGLLAAQIIYRAALAQASDARWQKAESGLRDELFVGGDNPPSFPGLAKRPEWMAQAAGIAARFDCALENERNAKKRIAIALTAIGDTALDPRLMMRGLALSRVFWGMFESSDEVSTAYRALSQRNEECGSLFSYLMSREYERFFEDERDRIVDLEKRAHNDAEDTSAVHGAQPSHAQTLAVLGALQTRLEDVRRKSIWALTIVSGIAVYLVFH